MLLCCFREPKEPKKPKTKNRLEQLDEEPSAQLLNVKNFGKSSDNFVKTQQNSSSRPLKAPVTPSSLSSNNEAEVLVANVTYHGQPPPQQRVSFEILREIEKMPVFRQIAWKSFVFIFP